MAEMNNLQIQLPVKRAAVSKNKDAAVRDRADKPKDSFGKVMDDTASEAGAKDTKEVKDTREVKNPKDSKEVKDSKDLKTDGSGRDGGNRTPEENTAVVPGAPALLLQSLCAEAAAVRPEIQLAAAEETALPVETAIPAAEKQTDITGAQTVIPAGERAGADRSLEAGTAGRQTAGGETKEPADRKTASELKTGVRAENQGTDVTGKTTAQSDGEAAGDRAVQTTVRTAAERAVTEGAATEGAMASEAKAAPVKQPEKEADKPDIRVLQQLTNEQGTPQLQGEEPLRIKVAEPFYRMDEKLTRQLGDQVTKSLEQGKEELHIQLEPEHLGKISIKISVLNEEIRVLVSCDNQKTQGLLAERSDGLGRIIENNMKSPVVVEVKDDNALSQQKNATDQHENRGGGQQEHKQENPKEDSDGFLQQMRLGIFEDRMAAGG